MSTSTTAVGRILLIVAICGLLHSAFSSCEQLSKLKAAGTPTQLPTVDIIAEALLSLVIFTLGGALWSPELKANTWASEMAHRTLDQMDTRMGFVGFGHRGRFMSGNLKGRS